MNAVNSSQSRVVDRESYGPSLLHTDRAKIKHLFAKFAHADDETERRRLLNVICGELTSHPLVHEEIIYSSMCEIAEN